MSTITDNWLDHWDCGDLADVTTSELNLWNRLKNNNNNGDVNKKRADISDKRPSSDGYVSQDETLQYDDEEFEDETRRTAVESGFRSRINGGSGFDAPYVSRLYQLCYDTGTGGEVGENNEEEQEQQEEQEQVSEERKDEEDAAEKSSQTIMWAKEEMLDQFVNAVRSRTTGLKGRQKWSKLAKRDASDNEDDDDNAVDNCNGGGRVMANEGLLNRHKNVAKAELDADWGIRVILPEEEMDELRNVTRYRNNREEIRRKLAMGSDTDDYYGGERGLRKPSLQSRLQSGMNLQICFMNETANESETLSGSKTGAKFQSADHTTAPNADSNLITKFAAGNENGGTVEQESTNFISKQARLQAEARVALAQAKQMARMQMEVEKQRKKKSPIAEIVGIPFPDGKYKLSRHALSVMNLAQLQVIVNDLHTQIENLNEELVQLLLGRDDLHMEQDSMLVDIEDLTRHL